MQLVDLTLSTPAENLALDEALLDEAESAGCPTETFRLWEPPQPMIVVGRSSRIADEVQIEEARRRGIPVLRRSSGGAAIVTGPGCLMYAVVLAYELHPAIRAVDHAHQFVLEKIAAALRPGVSDLRVCGTSDLAVGDRKFSGNSIRAKRDHLLYHGTLLYDFSLELISSCLKMPRRQPDYRQGRGHEQFVANLPLNGAALRAALVAAWDVAGKRSEWPRNRTERLVLERYGRPEWHESR
jgi:lipoate-protein ligase A